jgi:serine/threonine-protein kinase
VLLSKEGIIKLTDFGIAKAAERSARTKTGEIKGHFAYLSPEQAFGRSVDRRSDLFALGLLAYELLTGKRAYDARNDVAVLRQAQHAELDLALVPAPFRPWLEKALATEPDARFQRAADMLGALRELGDPAQEREVARIVSAHAVEPPSIEEAEEPALPTVVSRAQPRPPYALVAGALAVAVGLGLWRALSPPKAVPESAPVALSAPPPAPASEAAPQPGYLSINARPWAAVYVDGLLVAKETPLKRHALLPGRHSVSLRRPNGARASFDIDIVQGETLTRHHDWGLPTPVTP